MRHRIPQRHPRLTRSRVLTGVTALLTVIAVAAGCSSAATPAPTPSVSASGSVPPSGAAAPAGAAAPLTRSAPVRVQIPAIGVDSALMQLGLQVDGSCRCPRRAFKSNQTRPLWEATVMSMFAGPISATVPSVMWRIRTATPSTLPTGVSFALPCPAGQGPVFGPPRRTVTHPGYPPLETTRSPVPDGEQVGAERDGGRQRHLHRRPAPARPRRRGHRQGSPATEAVNATARWSSWCCARRGTSIPSRS